MDAKWSDIWMPFEKWPEQPFEYWTNRRHLVFLHTGPLSSVVHWHQKRVLFILCVLDLVPFIVTCYDKPVLLFSLQLHTANSNNCVLFKVSFYWLTQIAIQMLGPFICRTQKSLVIGCFQYWLVRYSDRNVRRLFVWVILLIVVDPGSSQLSGKWIAIFKFGSEKEFLSLWINSFICCLFVCLTVCLSVYLCVCVRALRGYTQSS